MQRTDKHLQIGSLLFDGLDQIDLTGPFEILSRIPDSTYRIYAKSTAPVRDIRGLRLAPDATLDEAPQLDVLHVPGGYGQEALMQDEAILSWVRRQAEGAICVFSVCTGALICGAAGLLKGRRATSHWGAFHLLPLFGAIPVDQRIVIDGSYLFAAGVTAGIDGALRLVAELRGDSRRAGDSTLHAVRSGAALQCRYARLGTAGHSRARAAFIRRHHGTPRRDRATLRRATRREGRGVGEALIGCEGLVSIDAPPDTRLTEAAKTV